MPSSTSIQIQRIRQSIEESVALRDQIADTPEGGRGIRRVKTALLTTRGADT